MEEPTRVALCVTCLVDQMMPEIGVATVRLLRRAGVEVEFPADQSCCGQPFFNSGFRDEAIRLARRTIEIFEPYDAVVLPSGSCTTMFRVEYPHLLEETPGWKARAGRLAARTYELSEYLVEVLGWSPERVRASGSEVTYHDSCHMCRLLDLGAEPRALLEGAGYPIREMEESDRCCGFGGLFSVRMPEVANAMSREKLDRAAATGAATLVTADPGCLMQLRGMAGDGIRVEHVATLVEEATR